MMNYLLFLILSTVMLVQSEFLHEFPELEGRYPEPVLNFQIDSGSPIKDHGPFPPTIFISFWARGKEWKSELSLNKDIIADDAMRESIGDDSDINHKKIYSRVYHSGKGEKPFISATVVDKDRILATIITEKDVFRIIPIEELSAASVASMDGMKMIMYKEDDVPVGGNNVRRSLSAVKYENFIQENRFCYRGQEKQQNLGIGIVLDQGYREALGGDKTKWDAVIQEYVDKTNLILFNQLKIKLQIFRVIDNLVGAAANTKQQWNQRPTPILSGACPNENGTFMTLPQHLEYFLQWKITYHFKDTGIWHLLTNCHKPPGTTGFAYINALCSDRSGVGITSYTDTDVIKDTWRTFAHQVAHNFGAGHSFENGRGKTGGLMDSGNGIYPYVEDPTASQNPVQLNPLRKTQLCDHIDFTIRNQDPNSLTCFTPADKTYSWTGQNEDCSTIPDDCLCNNAGQGKCTTTVVCKDQTNNVVLDSECPVPRPFGRQMDCTPTIPCPARNNNTLCIMNNVIDFGEECDNNDGCCTNCKRIVTADCIKRNQRRDAAFNYFKNKSKNFVFQGESYGRYMSKDNQVLDLSVEKYPRPIRGFWRNLDEKFFKDIDALLQRTEGRCYFFKGNFVTEYEVGFGQHEGYPMNIAASIFSTVTFSQGKPGADRPIEAAVSLQQGAYFFQGTEYVKFTYGQVVQDSSYPRSISDFQLNTNHFKTGVSAAIHYWDTNEVDFFSYSGVRQRWKFGVGNIGNFVKLNALDVTEESLQQTLGNCEVPDCIQCDIANTCSQCAVDYLLASGRCYPNNFMIEIEFDYVKADKSFIKSTSFPDNQWGVDPGITGFGMKFTSVDFILVQPPTTPLKDFEFHFWIKLDSILRTTILQASARVGGTNVQMSVTCFPQTSTTWTVTYQFGNTPVPSQEKLNQGEWDHLIFTFINGEVRNTVNGNVAALTDLTLLNLMDGETQPPLYLTEIKIGDSWVGHLDQFHVDNLNIPYSNLQTSSSSHLSSSFWLVSFFIICYCYCGVF